MKPATIDKAAAAGANLIVSGSGVYKATDMAENISLMRRSVTGFPFSNNFKQTMPP